MQQGLFITLEGIDGVGKTTQALLLKGELERQGYSVLHTFEPGGTKLGSKIRSLLLNPEHEELHSMTEVLLYAADRAQHVAEKVLPALKDGKMVICERFIDSSIAYQGYGLGFEIEAIKTINHWAAGGLWPDLTVYLDGDPAQFLAKTKGDRIEQRTLDYYNRVRRGFLEIAQAEPDRVKVVSAEGTREAVSQRVLQALEGRCG
ncbi:MAG: dTMP kinase [Firmicutes bacterium]|nr:dTMP kinase [Bacillota bacterium]NLO66939.1 dTMP kinase [Bacillota bacterium]